MIRSHCMQHTDFNQTAADLVSSYIAQIEKRVLNSALNSSEQFASLNLLKNKWLSSKTVLTTYDCIPKDKHTISNSSKKHSNSSKKHSNSSRKC